LLAEISRRVETPAFVVDERRLLRDVQAAVRLRDACGFELLYALKPLCCEFILEQMAPWLDGFAASSLFEARLARDVIGRRGQVHLTTPGLRAREMEEIGELCDHVSFNSLSQLHRLGRKLPLPDQIGLRVNPQLSVVADARYDPCRRHSKLGVPLDELVRRWTRRREHFECVSGLHFHTNCDSADFAPLDQTVRHLEQALGSRLASLRFINLGGGYLFEPGGSALLLAETVGRLRGGYGLRVFIEPGAALVRRSGYLVTTVVDMFRSEGQSIAVLDTSVNHMPEVFEYQFEPDVLGDRSHRDHEYLLAGSSCLAGDIFGVYAFRRPLRLGGRVVVRDVGAYALVKAHMFNGINLPAVYSVTPEGELVLRRRFTYDDFVSRFGARRDAAV
jgi:carboxynorspermidine decarboxylase